jgi:hypothetical protein
MSDGDFDGRQLKAIQSFGNDGTADIFFGNNTSDARNLLDPNDFSKAQEIMDK